MSTPVSAEEYAEIYDYACEVREHAYVPYSKKRVGAALRSSSGAIYAGCNIENSSYGGTVCAERVAIWKAVSEEGDEFRLAEIVVVTDANPPWPPCGLCRQVMAEFADPTARVHAANLDGQTRTSTLGELFPHAFTPAHLSQS